MQDAGYKIKSDIAGILYLVSVLSETWFLEMPFIHMQYLLFYKNKSPLNFRELLLFTSKLYETGG